MWKTLLLCCALTTPALADKNLENPGDGTSWDCGSDPIVNINYDKGAFTITGACTELNVNGASVTVTAEDVATLNINGGKNKATVTSLGAVNINGASNRVTWKKPKTGKKPVAAVNGKGNAVVKAK